MRKILSKIKDVLNREDAYSTLPFGVFLSITLCILILIYIFSEDIINDISFVIDTLKPFMKILTSKNIIK